MAPPRLQVLIVVLLATGGFLAEASELTISTDAPADLGATTYLANQTERHENDVWTLRFDGPAEGVGPGMSIDALFLREDGSFLFSCDVPFTHNGTTFLPGDVIERAEGDYTLFKAAADLGLGASADVDALTQLADGILLLSFDAPVMVEGTSIHPQDVARVTGSTLEVFLDGGALGIPDGINLIGYDRDDDGSSFMAFDVPVDLDGNTYLPGDIVRYDGGSFSLWHRDEAYPARASTNALALPGSPGYVEELLLEKAGADVELTWQPTCSTEGSDYAVYEGTIGSFSSHEPVVCTTSGATSAIVTPMGDLRYFLVAPRNGTFEGSFGTNSMGDDRGMGLAPCVGLQRIRACF